MYNRYLSTAPDVPAPVHDMPAHTVREAAEPAGLFGGLSQRLGGLRLDADTLIALAVVWFVLQDGADGGLDLELLLAIGALLVLGL